MNNTLPIRPDTPWLAPLAGYTDLPFRMLCRHYGCTVANTEMVSVKGLHYDSHGTKRLLETCSEDTPLVVQLFGAEAALFRPVMESLVEQGFKYFDLNAGCSVRKVLRTGSGSSLLQRPDDLCAIVREMVAVAGEGNVGVKIRSGFNAGEDISVHIGQRLEDCGVAWLTLHPRTARQLFGGTADWSQLETLKRSVGVPVLGSGDLYTAEDGLRCLEQTGIDGIMFARGAMFDPAIFARFAALRSSSAMPPVDGAHLAEIVRNHIRFTRQYDGSERSFRKVRSILPRYARKLQGIKTYRNRLSDCSDWSELEEVADSISLLKPATSG